MLDRALAAAKIARDKAYVTNAVRHFKFTPRGKIRLHRKPGTMEINACHPWLTREREILRPRLVVATGTTAAQSIFGKAVTVGKNRSRVTELGEATKAMVTIHPSYLLRMDEAEREREFARFVHDLRLAAPYARLRNRAA